MEVKNMEIRAFTEKDAEDTAKVIAETLRISNSRDYTAEQIEAIIAGLSAEELVKGLERTTHVRDM